MTGLRVSRSVITMTAGVYDKVFGCRPSESQKTQGVHVLREGGAGEEQVWVFNDDGGSSHEEHAGLSYGPTRSKSKHRRR